MSSLVSNHKAKNKRKKETYISNDARGKKKAWSGGTAGKKEEKRK